MIRKEKLSELKKYIEELRTISVIEKQECSFLSIKSYEFVLKNGETLKREEIIKNGSDGSAVIIFPVLNSGEILTVIEPRVFTDMTVGIGFPAGYIEENETVSAAAFRELKEETGYKSEKIITLDSFYQDEGCSKAYNHIVLANNCQKVSAQSLDQDEYIRYMTFKYQELLELEKLGYINGVNSKLALVKSKKYILGG